MKKELDVVAALIQKNDTILLCQRNKGDRYGLLWEFPGGCVEEGEEFTRAIEREIKEEIDLDIEAKELVKTFEDEDPALKIKVFLYECLIVGGEPKALDCKDLGFFSCEEIERLDLAPADKKIFTYLKQLKIED